MIHHFTLLLCSLTLFAGEPQVGKLSPPRIPNETVLEKIVCTSPMRDGTFNISVEEAFNKTIIHCYGHGGSGWTTLFSSVQKAIDLFEQTNLSKDVSIKVIGAGCVGLKMSIELYKMGYQDISISSKSLYDTPSWKAGGCFALPSRVSPDEQEAVKLMPLYCCEDIAIGVKALEDRGLIPPREYVSLEFDSGVIHPDYIKYMNTTNLMQQLMKEVERLGIRIEIEEITSFKDVKEEVVFDSSGLGVKELNSDLNMTAVRGHLIPLNHSSGTGHMDYMLTSKVKQYGKEAYIYMFPKNLSVTPIHEEGKSCMGVLGGTFISDTEEEIVDEIEFRNLLDRNCEFFYGHPFNH